VNPVQFKVDSVNKVKKELEGMTVFNTNQVNTKKQPMFFGQPLGIQRYDSYKYPVFEKLTTQQLGYFGDVRRFHSKKTEVTITHFAQSKNTSILPT